MRNPYEKFQKTHDDKRQRNFFECFAKNHSSSAEHGLKTTDLSYPATGEDKSRPNTGYDDVKTFGVPCDVYVLFCNRVILNEIYVVFAIRLHGIIFYNYLFFNYKYIFKKATKPIKSSAESRTPQSDLIKKHNNNVPTNLTDFVPSMCTCCKYHISCIFRSS